MCCMTGWGSGWVKPRTLLLSCGKCENRQNRCQKSNKSNCQILVWVALYIKPARLPVIMKKVYKYKPLRWPPGAGNIYESGQMICHLCIKHTQLVNRQRCCIVVQLASIVFKSIRMLIISKISCIQVSNLVLYAHSTVTVISWRLYFCIQTGKKTC